MCAFSNEAERGTVRPPPHIAPQPSPHYHPLVPPRRFLAIAGRVTNAAKPLPVHSIGPAASLARRAFFVSRSPRSPAPRRDLNGQLVARRTPLPPPPARRRRLRRPRARAIRRTRHRRTAAVGQRSRRRENPAAGATRRSTRPRPPSLQRQHPAVRRPHRIPHPR